MNPVPEVGLGLVGCGLWGENLLRDALQLGARVWVADPSDEARSRAYRMGAEGVFQSSRELPPVDGIVVATPASTHHAVISELLDRRVPIFTEKPFTLDLTEAQDLVQIAGEQIFVLHVWRYHPGVRVLKELIQGDGLGPPELLRSFRTNWTSARSDCDPVWTLLPHDFSIFLELTDALPPVGFARAEFSAGRAVGMLALLDGAFPCIAEVSTRYADKRRELRLHGCEGVAELTSDGMHVLIHRGSATTEQPQTERIDLGEQTALQREILAVLEYLRGGPAPVSGADDALLIATRMHEARALAGLDSSLT
jgi:predicted dehydrogenase